MTNEYVKYIITATNSIASTFRPPRGPLLLGRNGMLPSTN
jgi:hypothetical protein